MIHIPMDENGPDMDMIEELVKDESVKGVFFCHGIPFSAFYVIYRFLCILL